LHHTATYCNILQHTATHCNNRVLFQKITSNLGHPLFAATHCNKLQHTATNCNTLQHSATPHVAHEQFRAPAICCNTLQQTATHYNILQHLTLHMSNLERPLIAATHCNTLQHTATHCNAPQHTATPQVADEQLRAPCRNPLHRQTHAFWRPPLQEGIVGNININIDPRQHQY